MRTDEHVSTILWNWNALYNCSSLFICKMLSFFLQVTFVTRLPNHTTVLREFQLMLEDFFEQEGIAIRLVDVIASSLIFICETAIKNVEAIRRLADKKSDHLCQLSIQWIELQYDGSEPECIPVSLFGLSCHLIFICGLCIVYNPKVLILQ